MKPALILCLFCVHGFGATWYVTTTGNDSTGDGSAGNPWRTIQKGVNATSAGDTVIVGNGDYGEYVSTHANGSSGSPITIQATNVWGVTTHQFRVQHTFHTITGFRISKPTNINKAHVRIEVGGSNLILTNNFLGPGCFVISTNASFDSVANSVTCPDVNFTTAGFAAGALAFWGASGLSNATFGTLYYTNHDTAHTVSSISGDGHTMFVSETVTNDTGSHYWIYCYAGTDNNGMPGVATILGSGITVASNLTIVNNHFEQLAGSALSGTGDGGLIRGNTFTNIQSWYGIIMNGRNSVIESNLWINNHNVLYYTLAEINSLTHPGGGSFFDYQIGHVNHYVNAATTNNIFRYNWLQNVDSQSLVLQYFPGGNDNMKMQSNVFVGFTYNGSVSLNNMTWDHNTMVWCSYDFSKIQAIGFGGDSGQSQTETNLNVNSNVWVNIGDHANLSQEGSFSVVSVTNSTFNGNFAAGSETMGWRAVTLGANSNWFLVNGGDPLFANINNPLGPDGIPFTADDGLRPLPTSAIASNGLGALVPLPSSTVAAHFIETNITTWQSDTTTNYSSAWLALAPPYRGAPERPWQTAEMLGSAPLYVTFDASASLDGSTLSHKDIQWYVWNFGDGRKDTVYKIPWIKHLFATNGTFQVTLQVTTWSGVSASYTNTYSVSNINHSVFTKNLWLVSTNGSDSNDGTNNPFLTLAHAESVVQAGDIVAVLKGFYSENLDITRNVGTAANPVTFYSYGAECGGFNIRYPYHTFDGFRINCTNVAKFGALCYIYPIGTNVQILHNEFVGEQVNTNRGAIIMQRGASGTGLDPTQGPSGCTVSFNAFHDLWGTGDFPIIVQCLDGQSNLFQANIAYNCQGQPDFFRVWGANSDICDNFETNMSSVIENHTDFFQIFNNTNTPIDYVLATNIVIERNYANGGQMSVCTIQGLVNGGTINSNSPSGVITNIIFKNNIWYNILEYEIDAAADGVKVYNDLFYKDPNAALLSMGGGNGSGFGIEMFNCVFFQCGSDYSVTNVGWYDNRLNGNSTFSADYNFVCGSNYWQKIPAPPNDFQHWANTGQDAHGINGGNPLFVQEGLDFHLQSGSPLKGSGNTIASVTDDFDGTPRSAPYDIGPFAFSAGITPPPPAGLETTGLIGNATISGNAVLKTQ